MSLLPLFKKQASVKAVLCSSSAGGELSLSSCTQTSYCWANRQLCSSHNCDQQSAGS